MTHIAVVVPTLYNKAGGYEALQSIKGSEDITWEPIIMDNWRNPQRSVTQSWNQGVDIALDMKSDYILVINDDILFSPWTLTGLVKAFETPMKPDKTAMVTGRNLRGTMEPEDIFGIEIPSHKEHEFDLNPDFSCFMITPDTFNKVGRFDENFQPAYFEDNDYHYRIKLCDQVAISSCWAPYYHYGSVTQNFDPNSPTVRSDQYVQNEWYYISKWGGMGPGTEIYEHPYNDKTMAPSRWIYSR